jgi:hemerythrin-like metal-binding protein
MPWDESLCVGVGSVDSQHKKLVEMIDIFDLAVDTVPDTELINSTLHFLDEYVAKHFEHEEKLQIMTKYPEYAPHKQIHEDFVMDFTDIKKQIAIEGFTIDLILYLHDFLIHWLINHIRVVDVKFGAHCGSLGLTDI